MSHLNTDTLHALDQSALDHARALQASLSGFRMEDGGGDGGDGDGGGDSGGDAGGDGGDGSGDGDGDDGGQADLQQQALDAIAALKQTGAQIPEALTAAVQQLKDARGEAANYRTKLRDVESKQTQHDEVLQGIAKALGLAKDGDGDPDPAQLQSALAEKDAALRTQTIELTAMKAAPKHGADPQALLDSRTFLEKASKLDPDGEKFTAELDALVKTTVEENPKLKASQAPAKGGADHSGGTGEKTAKTLEDAVTARMGS